MPPSRGLSFFRSGFKYANPSPEDAAFHVDCAMRFICRFAKDELKLNIEEHVPSEYLCQLMP